MRPKIALGREALRGAMQLRRSLSIPREAPINAFDIAAMVGADVRFLDAKSLEGMLVRDPGLRVLLPSTRHRPMGRILFTCAHEIAHHYFGHGTRVDPYMDGCSNELHTEEEFLADAFAAHLLMPRPAVKAVLDRLELRCERLTSVDALVVSGILGVGYGTFLMHANRVLEIITSEQRNTLSKAQPKAIRADILEEGCERRLLVADSTWSSVPIDLEVGEILLLPRECAVTCDLLLPVRERGEYAVYTAARPGLARLSLGAETVLRIAREHYVGPLSHRYLEDPDEH